MRNKILSDLEKKYSDGMTLSEFCSSADYSEGMVLHRFDSWTNAKVKAGVEDANSCPNCGKYYDRLSNHWNKCGEPELSQKQKNIITGAVMSDASVTEKGSVSIYNSNKQFLEWVDKKLGFMSYGVYLNDSGENRHKRNMKSGFDVERDAEYKDIYRVGCPTHSFTRGMRELYKENGKEIHEIELNPEIIKLWYVGDGGLNWSDDKYAYPEIRAISQSMFDDELESMFDKFDLDVSVSSGSIRIYSDADKFLSLIGEAPDGMEYKWENKNRDIYNELKP